MHPSCRPRLCRVEKRGMAAPCFTRRGPGRSSWSYCDSGNGTAWQGLWKHHNHFKTDFCILLYTFVRELNVWICSTFLGICMDVFSVDHLLGSKMVQDCGCLTSEVVATCQERMPPQINRKNLQCRSHRKLDARRAGIWKNKHYRITSLIPQNYKIKVDKSFIGQNGFCLGFCDILWVSVSLSGSSFDFFLSYGF